MKDIPRGVMILVVSLTSLSSACAQEAAKTTACEHLVNYVREARKIIRDYEAFKRAKRLLSLKRGYADRIRPAPEAARIAAAQWIFALNRADHKIRSGDMEDSAVFHVRRFRNRALSACGIKGEEVGS